MFFFRLDNHLLCKLMGSQQSNSFDTSPDTNFDKLIQSIYGDVGKLEEYEEEEIKKLNKKNMNNAYAESRKQGILYQAEQRVCIGYGSVSVL